MIHWSSVQKYVAKESIMSNALLRSTIYTDDERKNKSNWGTFQMGRNGMRMKENVGWLDS
jgi:hypothetical protein